MSRRIIYQGNAAFDLDVILNYIDSRSTIGVLNWLDEYEKTLARKAENPEQFPVAPESSELTLKFATRSQKRNTVSLIVSFLSSVTKRLSSCRFAVPDKSMVAERRKSRDVLQLQI